MKQDLSSFTALAVAAAFAAALIVAAPSVAHESNAHDDDFAGMGPNMMGHGMMGHGGMGTGMGYGMGRGMSPCSQNVRADMDRDLSVKDVTEMLQLRLDRWNNDRLKVGKVVEKDDDTIIAEIVTKDGSLVDRLAIDRDTGSQRRIK